MRSLIPLSISHAEGFIQTVLTEIHPKPTNRADGMFPSLEAKQK